MAQVGNPHRRKPRDCEVCGTSYIPTYSGQRSCGRTCGLTIRFGDDLYAKEPNMNDANQPMAREREWLTRTAKPRAAAAMLARYHADPRNWSTAKKRRRLFERDAWQCRTCRKHVTDTVPAGHPNRAVAGHILAKATGGQWTDDNMATLCHPCNVRDGVNRIPIQTAMAF